MQLPERDGIACDQCGMTCRHDFTYYSFDFRPVVVTDNRKQSLDSIFHNQVVFSLDVCPACYDKIAADVVKNYSKIMSPTRRTRVDTVCELSGKTMIGSYTYYHLNVTKVSVRMSGQASICVKCKTATDDKSKPCVKCAGTRFIRPASVTSTDRFVEVNLCEDMYKRLTETAGKVRQVAGAWSTNS
jgi:hypothetical protein